MLVFFWGKEMSYVTVFLLEELPAFNSGPWWEFGSEKVCLRFSVVVVVVAESNGRGSMAADNDW